MNRVALLLLLTSLASPAAAQDTDRVIKPEIRAGDRWTYSSRNVLDNGAHTYEVRVERSDGKTILVVGTRKGDDKEFDGTFTPEWNPVVGLSGLIFSPPPGFFAFPMQVGDARTLAYTSSRPRTNVPPTEYKTAVRVAGWEEVTVPAGKYRAMKVVVEGSFFPPFSRGPAMVRMTYWYAPEVRRWAKLRIDWPAMVSEEELLEFKLNEN